MIMRLFDNAFSQLIFQNRQQSKQKKLNWNLQKMNQMPRAAPAKITKNIDFLFIFSSNNF